MSYVIVINIFVVIVGFLPQWPHLLLEVQSIDSWSRHSINGYGYMQLPMTTGPSHHNIGCWRPTGSTQYEEMRRFFIGGSSELEDLTYVSTPSAFDGKQLSKFGFRTLATGDVSVKLNCIQQSQ